MNIGALAQLTGVSTDTLRYYEREQLLAAPRRAANGYRVYGESDAQRVRFVRSAQAMGFSLTEIRAILPQMEAGQLQRADIEARLGDKLAEIDRQIERLQQLRQEVLTTLGALTCRPQAGVSVAQATDNAKAAAHAPRSSPSGRRSGPPRP